MCLDPKIGPKHICHSTNKMCGLKARLALKRRELIVCRVEDIANQNLIADIGW